MQILKSIALGMTIFTLAGGAALAEGMMKNEGAMKSGAMKTDSMAAKPMAMSAKDMKMMKSCKAMSSDMMMKDKGCMKMAKAHPDMVQGGAMTTNGMRK